MARVASRLSLFRSHRQPRFRQVSDPDNAKGPNSATATACSAGAHAIGDSFKIIQRGDARRDDLWRRRVGVLRR